MEDTNREIRVTDDSAAEQSDEDNAQETSVVLTARLLANPRRVRRNCRPGRRARAPRSSRCVVTTTPLISGVPRNPAVPGYTALHRSACRELFRHVLRHHP
jgi:hypothetical protein